MDEPKPFASLTASMLARKGQARPAMRSHGATPVSDDLGWNDMGRDTLVTTSRPIPVGPATAVAPLTPPPPVLHQQAQLAREFAAPKPAAPALRPEDAIARLPRGARGKSAFTLRIDSERHVRLRLACAVKHVSAQQIVTEALDALLASLPEIETLAAHLPSSGKSTGR